MNFCARKSILFLAALLPAISFSARAEDGIIFSQPTNGIENVRSFLAPPTPQAQFAAPSQSADFDPGLFPSPQLPQLNNALSESLEARKNWMFMTPEEILGVPTPEKMLGLPENPDEKNLTPEQKFLKRQQQASALSVSNSWQRFDKVFSSDDDSGSLFKNSDEKNQWNWQSGSDQVPAADSKKYLNQFWNAPAAPNAEDENQNSAWRSAFDFTPPDKKNEEQLEAQKAAMERFREMMQPTPEVLPLDTKFSAPPRDPNLQEVLQDNPAGHSFAQLQSSVLKPTGINPMGNAGLHKTEKKKSVLESESDLPPWLRDGPQPGIPQRKF